MTIDFNGFEAPNHTQTPNDFFDRVLPNIKYFSELKVVLVIIRKTFGWHKVEDKISFSQLVELTGMNRKVVNEGIQHALKDGIIERRQEGQYFFYRLKLVTLSNQLPEVTSYLELPEVVTESNQKPAKLVTRSNPQNKEKKETINKEGVANAIPAPKPKKETPEINPAVKAYQDTFRKTPTEAARKLISEKITNLGLWQSNMDEWSLSGWNPLNVNGMVARYLKLVGSCPAETPSSVIPLEMKDRFARKMARAERVGG